MKIEPTYVTFEQAELFEEKGLECHSECNQWLLAKDKEDDSKRFICLNSELDSYTQIDEDTYHNHYHCLTIPEQWQVIEWLRINHGIWIGVELYHNMDGKLFSSFIQTNNKKQSFNGNKTPQEAYSVAFDYILKELI